MPRAQKVSLTKIGMATNQVSRGIWPIRLAPRSVHEAGSVRGGGEPALSTGPLRAGLLVRPRPGFALFQAPAAHEAIAIAPSSARRGAAGRTIAVPQAARVRR